MLEEIKRYDPYTDKFIKKTTTDRIEVGADGSLYNSSISTSFGLYAKNQEALDKCDYIDKSTKLYTKDEVIAMLEEIKNGIDYRFHDDGGYYADKDEVDIYIQQKINALKENKDNE